jgi:hypothetical protein
VSASSATNRAAVLVAAALREQPSEERVALLAQQLEAFSLAGPSNTPPTPSRRPRLAWSEDETRALLEDVKVFGTGKWEQVLASFAHRFQPRRCAEDLRSRIFRANLRGFPGHSTTQKFSELTIPRNNDRRRRPVPQCTT